MVIQRPWKIYKSFGFMRIHIFFWCFSCFVQILNLNHYPPRIIHKAVENLQTYAAKTYYNGSDCKNGPKYINVNVIHSIFYYQCCSHRFHWALIVWTTSLLPNCSIILHLQAVLNGHSYPSITQFKEKRNRSSNRKRKFHNEVKIKNCNYKILHIYNNLNKNQKKIRIVFFNKKKER